MFNVKAMILLFLAIVIGGTAAVSAQQWLVNQKSAVQADESETVEVVVAKETISAGHPIQEQQLETVVWPANAAPAEAFSDPRALIGKLLTQDVLPGEPLLKARVVDKLDGSRLSVLIAPDKRAQTVRVDDIAGVAGFLLPGNRVDVLVTRMQNKRADSSLLLQNIKVLAIDQQANQNKNEPLVVRAVTLEVDISEARQLAGAQSEGTIQLVLRNPTDTLVEIEPVALPARAPAVRSRDVTVIRGSSVDSAQVQL